MLPSPPNRPSSKEKFCLIVPIRIDLNNHLFVQLERLIDESLKGEKLTSEITRAEAVARIAEQIVAIANQL